MANPKARGLIQGRNAWSSNEERHQVLKHSSPTDRPKPRLLDQVRQAIRTRHYSPKTEEAYVGWIKRFIFFHNKRHPAEMGETEIVQFLSSLACDAHVSASTQNQALNGILFLYHEVLGKEIGYVNGVVRAKRPHRLPVVLTREEIQALLSQLRGTEWLMAMLLYGAGLRLMECLRLRVKDIDFSTNQIVVREGKGQKDRVTMLPSAIREPLRQHLEEARDSTRRTWSTGTLEPPCPTPWNENIPAPLANGDGSMCSRLQGSAPTPGGGWPADITFMSPFCSGQSRTLCRAPG